MHMPGFAVVQRVGCPGERAGVVPGDGYGLELIAGNVAVWLPPRGAHGREAGHTPDSLLASQFRRRVGIVMIAPPHHDGTKHARRIVRNLDPVVGIIR